MVYFTRASPIILHAMLVHIWYPKICVSFWSFIGCSIILCVPACNHSNLPNPTLVDCLLFTILLKSIVVSYVIICVPILHTMMAYINYVCDILYYLMTKHDFYGSQKNDSFMIILWQSMTFFMSLCSYNMRILTQKNHKRTNYQSHNSWSPKHPN